MTDSPGTFEFDPRRCEITGPLGLVRLEPRAAQLLEILLARKGAVASREELLDSVWSGRVVTDAALTGAVSQLRRAFKQAGVRHLEIRTHSKRGYSLESRATPREAHPRSRYRTALAGLLMAAIVPGLGVVAWKATDSLTSLDGVRLDFDITFPDGQRSDAIIWLRDGREGRVSLDGQYPLDIRVVPELSNGGLLRLRFEAAAFAHWSGFEQMIGLDTESHFTLRSETPGTAYDIRFTASRAASPGS